MPAVVALSPLYQFFDDQGDPLVGGLLYTYQTDSTTPAMTWQDQLQVAANTNPIILDDRGECRLWLDPSLAYRLALHDATDVPIWSVDAVSGSVSGGNIQNPDDPAQGDALVAVKQPVSGAVSTTQHEVNFRQLWLADFGCMPDGQDATPGMIAALAAAQSLGGATLMAERGEYVFEAPFSFDGDDISIWGQGADATTFVIRHTGGYGIGMKRNASPALSRNLGLHRLRIDYDTSVGPDPSTTRLIEAEYVQGLIIRDVATSRGGVALALLGCSAATVDGFSWLATDGQAGAGRVGVLIGATTSTYTAGDVWGVGVAMRGLHLADTAVAAGTIGVRIECGEDISIGDDWSILRMTTAIAFLRSVAMTGVPTERVTISGAGRIVGDQFMRFAHAVAAEVVQSVTLSGATCEAITAGTATGIGATTNFQQIADLVIERCVFDGYQQIGLGSAPSNVPARIVSARIADNRIRAVPSVALAAYGLYAYAGIEDATIAGNVLICDGATNQGSAIWIAGSDSVAVAGNTLIGFQNDLIVDAASTRLSIDGNVSQCNAAAFTLSGTPSPTNRVQGRPIAFRAYRSTPAQTTTSTTAVKVLCQSERYDPFGTYDAALARWTPGVVGTVSIAANVNMANGTTAGNLYVWIYKNGAPLARGPQTTIGVSTAIGAAIAIEDSCTATDYYELFAGIDAAGTKSISFNQDGEMTFFSGHVIP